MVGWDTFCGRGFRQKVCPYSTKYKNKTKKTIHSEQPLVALVCAVFVSISMYHLYARLWNGSVFVSAVPGFGRAISGRSVLLCVTQAKDLGVGWRSGWMSGSFSLLPWKYQHHVKSCHPHKGRFVLSSSLYVGVCACVWGQEEVGVYEGEVLTSVSLYDPSYLLPTVQSSGRECEQEVISL